MFLVQILTKLLPDLGLFFINKIKIVASLVRLIALIIHVVGAMTYLCFLHCVT